MFLSCQKKETKQTTAIYPVKIIKSIKKNVPIYLDNIGHVESINTVNVNSRIEGELMEVHFKEGDEVKEGDLLFTIDPRPYKADLEKAMGQLDESIANLFIAKDRFVRNKDLIKDEYISQLDFETLSADVKKSEALVKQNQGNLDYAKLNLEYCYIYAPISGKTGVLQVTKGNMIYPSNQEKIITINQLDPIYITFYSPEKELPKIQRYAKEKKLSVKVAFEDLKNSTSEGLLDLIDNEVDTQTGLIKLRAVFENQERKLWPGKFVKTRLILTELQNTIVIPFKAILMTSGGPIVFVIKGNNRAELRHVETGQREDDDIIILKGLEENEDVVIDGQLNLAQDTQIIIKSDEGK